MAMKGVGKEEGDGEGGKSDSDGNKGGQQATKRATVRVGRAIAMAMRVAGNKEGNGKGSKGNGNSNKGIGQGTAMTTKREWRQQQGWLMRKRVMAAKRAMATATKLASDKKGNGKGGKGNSIRTITTDFCFQVVRKDMFQQRDGWIRVGLVWSGVSKVRTKRSGALLTG